MVVLGGVQAEGHLFCPYKNHLTAQQLELTSVTTTRAEFNLVTNNSSLMYVQLDVKARCVYDCVRA